MRAKLTFPKDTRDVIEKLFANEILRRFPQYGTFWEEFIGRKSESTLALRPYGLTFPNTMEHVARSKLEKSYNKLIVRHYSLFCELAGAHYQFDRARESQSQSAGAQKHFLFWESFSNFYQHLGNMRNLLYGIWEEVEEITGKKENLKAYLTSTKHQNLCNQLETIEKEIIIIRNNLVQYMCTFNISVSDGYLIPLPIEEKPEPFIEPKQAIDAMTKMNSDLAHCEELLNAIEPLVSQLLRTFFSKKAILVDR